MNVNSLLEMLGSRFFPRGNPSGDRVTLLLASSPINPLTLDGIAAEFISLGTFLSVAAGSLACSWMDHFKD